jgi:drug/metabolite transporter (DMT)-like permease
MKIAGIILIVVGLFMLVSPSLNFTTREKVIDAGPLQVTANKNREIQWPTYAGGVVLAGGIVLLIASRKK